MSEKKKVYIAGPLNGVTADYIRNMHDMCATAERIRKLGFSVYVPCLDFLMGLLDGGYTYEDYFENSQPWLLSSDAVYFCERWESSTGCIKERLTAERHNIPRFADIDSLVAHFEIGGVNT